MKANSNIVLKSTTSATVLVPYRKEHVSIYHDWMQDEFLQEMTASEPLSIEEELAMQESWAKDEGKCTFIVLDTDAVAHRVGHSAKFGGMIGDVNLYFVTPTRAEAELMIAEPSARSRGHGIAALSLMLWYAKTLLGVQEVFARVSDKNAPSLRLFRDKLGWIETERSDFFGETTLEARGEVLERVTLMAGEVVVEEYE